MDRTLRFGFPKTCPIDGSQNFSSCHCSRCTWRVSDGQMRCGHLKWQDGRQACPVCGEAIPEVWAGPSAAREMVVFGSFCRGGYCWRTRPHQMAFFHLLRKAA